MSSSFKDMGSKYRLDLHKIQQSYEVATSVEERERLFLCKIFLVLLGDRIDIRIKLIQSEHLLENSDVNAVASFYECREKLRDLNRQIPIMREIIKRFTPTILDFDEIEDEWSFED